MPDYGVLSTGFSLKRLADIKAEIEGDLKESFGEINVDSDSVFGQIIGVYSDKLSQVWEQMENVYNAMYPNTAEGLNLDNAVSFTGLERLNATATTVVVDLQGTSGTVVPITSYFSQSGDEKIFGTDAAATILATALHQTIVAVDTIVDTYTYEVTINGYTIQFISDADATGPEIAEGLTDAINADSDVNEDVTATYVAGESEFTVTNVLLGADDVFTAVAGTNLSLDTLWTPVAATCTTDGAFPAPAGSVDTIDTPVVGLDAVTNLASGATGNNLETDTALRIRRINNLNVVAAGTLGAITTRVTQDIDAITHTFGYENTSESVDAYGRPAKSFEIIVTGTNTSAVDQLVAEKIWERKPAGIATFGSISKTVLDENGESQTVNFSRTSVKYIWVRLICGVTGAETSFPTNGRDIITAAIIALGDTLTYGSDILYQSYISTGYVAGGVTSVVCQVAVTDLPTDTPSYGSSNIAIGASYLPEFDASRITILGP